MLLDAIMDVVRRWAGPQQALMHSGEIELLGSLLYAGLTTGLGNPTLGEEYCDLRQVRNFCAEVQTQAAYSYNNISIPTP